MKDGAWGLSTGLIYNPGTYARTDELVALARVAARHGGLYASHIRDEGTGLLPALEEALTIGREAKLPVHISHLKSSGRASWGKAGDAIALLERARRAGMVVTADQYPYTASSTSLAATLIPARFRSGERKEYLERLADPDQIRELRAAITARLKGEKGTEIRIASCAARPRYNGKDLQTLARAEKKKPADIVLAIERLGGAQVVDFSMNEEDVRLIMKQSWVATASDGSAMTPTPGLMPHPRVFGCFARKLGRYAIEDGILKLPEAVRSATGLPADILHLPDRGYLKSGYFADVVVFDPRTYRDRATYEQPQRYADGVRYLFVNGRLAIDEGKATNVLAGRALRHESRQ
jgi:N-acyl-D-aspartate/D-glutamate deacylase